MPNITNESELNSSHRFVGVLPLEIHRVLSFCEPTRVYRFVFDQSCICVCLCILYGLLLCAYSLCFYAIVWSTFPATFYLLTQIRFLLLLWLLKQESKKKRIIEIDSSLTLKLYSFFKYFKKKKRIRLLAEKVCISQHVCVCVCKLSLNR